MSILVDENTKVIVQGITGRDGSFHARTMFQDGTRIVGGVTPGKGGKMVDSMPVFDSVQEAVRETGADCSVIFVPAPYATSAVREAVDAGMPLIVCITEGIPVLEMLRSYHYVKEAGVRLTDIYSSAPERVLMDSKAEFKQDLGKVDNNSIWGWSIDVTGER